MSSISLFTTELQSVIMCLFGLSHTQMNGATPVHSYCKTNFLCNSIFLHLSQMVHRLSGMPSTSRIIFFLTYVIWEQLVNNIIAIPLKFQFSTTLASTHWKQRVKNKWCCLNKKNQVPSLTASRVFELMVLCQFSQTTEWRNIWIFQEC